MHLNRLGVGTQDNVPTRLRCFPTVLQLGLRSVLLQLWLARKV